MKDKGCGAGFHARASFFLSPRLLRYRLVPQTPAGQTPTPKKALGRPEASPGHDARGTGLLFATPLKGEGRSHRGREGTEEEEGGDDTGTGQRGRRDGTGGRGDEAGPRGGFRRGTFELGQRRELHLAAVAAELRGALRAPLPLRLAHGFPREAVHFLRGGDGRRHGWAARRRGGDALAAGIYQSGREGGKK